MTMTPACSRCDSGLTTRYAVIDGENHCLPCVMDWAAEKRKARAVRAIDALPDVKGFNKAADRIGYSSVKDCQALTAAGAILRSLQLGGD